jgi:hypothetical protein
VTSSRSSLVLALLASAGCRQLLGLDEGTVANDAPPDDAMIDASPDADLTCKDSDEDGICNADDDWPCGVKPTAAPGSVTFQEQVNGNNREITITSARLSGGTAAGSDRLLVVPAGAAVMLTAMYEIIDCICLQCIDQIEIGLVAGGRQGCLFDDDPSGGSPASCRAPTTGTASRPLTAPTVAGRYDVRFLLGQSNACGMTPQWWGGVPPAQGSTIATICVFTPAP